MRFAQHKYLPYGLLALLAVPLFFLSIYDVHSWGDDFAQYIKEALNIAHGKPFYLSGYIYNPWNTIYAPPQYPPGYPLLLAPVVKIWGISYRAMAYFNTCLTVCLLFSLFSYFRKHSSMVTALCLSVLITYSGYLIGLKGNVLSDIPCLLFITLYPNVRNAETHSRKRILLLVVLAVAALLIRTQAIVLLAAECIYMVFSVAQKIIKERKFTVKHFTGQPSVYIVSGSFVLYFFLDKVIFRTPVNSSAFYGHYLDSTLQHSLIDAAKNNFDALVKVIPVFFHYDTYYNFPKAFMSLIESVAVAFVFTGFFISIKKRLAFDDVFFVLMSLLIMYFPYHDPRYFLPAVPLLFYYCFVTIKTLLPVITRIDARIVAVVVTLLYLQLGEDFLKKAATEVPQGCIPQQKELVAFSYISALVNDYDIIVFTRPRVLALYTNKKSINVSWELSHAQNKVVFDSLQVKYMLVGDGLDEDYFKTYLRNIQHPVDSVRISSGYTLYSLR